LQDWQSAWLCQPLLNKKTRLIHNFAKWLTRSLKKLNDAWNNNDASALAALFTKDAVLVNDTGPIYGGTPSRKRMPTSSRSAFQQPH
jgi:ketosteroid isomerase-like protein